MGELAAARRVASAEHNCSGSRERMSCHSFPTSPCSLPRWAWAARAPPSSDTLAVVAVGSVWKSWPLLRDAFVRAAYAGGRLAGGFRLLRRIHRDAWATLVLERP
jgi:hypothetical protein